MNIQKIHPIHFLYYREETTVQQLAEILNKGIVLQLQQEAARLNIQITGPVHWHYFGFMGDESKPFTLEVALPVLSIPGNYNGPFAWRTADTFSCVQALHYGAWQNIPNTYGQLFQFISQHQLTPTGENRELYIQADFVNHDANITLIQIGIQS